MIANIIGGGNGGVKLPVLNTPASHDKILNGYEVIDQNGNVVVGTIETVALQGPTFQFDDVTGIITAGVIAGPGYLDEENNITDTFEIPITSIATPSIMIDADGVVTATVVQSKGYIGTVGTASATMQLQVRTDNDLIIDSDGNVTAPAGYYPQAAVISTAQTAPITQPTISVSSSGLVTAEIGDEQYTHQITSADIPTLIPGNIRSGVNIAGVVGTVTGGVATTVTVTTGVSGAVVTAKCGNTTHTATCNSSGVATLSLTMAGTWTISAAHPTSGAYSTNDASVQVQSDFPITLTVGSSTTVSATGKYTATLSMAYRPSTGDDYKYNTYDSSFIWASAAMIYDDDNVITYQHFTGRANDNAPYPAYYDNAGVKEVLYEAIVYNYQPYLKYNYLETSSYDALQPANRHFGMHVGRWGTAGATLKTSGRAAAVFAGGYDGQDYMKYIDILYTIKNNNNLNELYAVYSHENSTTSSSDSNGQISLTTARAFAAASGYYTEIPYVLIAGGQTNSSGAVTATVEYIYMPNFTKKPSITKGTCTNLSTACSHLACVCSTNNNIYFAGGMDSSGNPTANVCSYNSSRTKTVRTSLSVARYNLAAAIAGGTFVAFAGGVGANGVSAVVDCYNLSGTRTTPVTLSVARHDMAGFTMGEYAVFAGGRTSISSGATNIIDMIGPNMIRTSTNMRYAKYGCSGIGGEYVGTGYVGYIFGGANASGGNAGLYERLTLKIV